MGSGEERWMASWVPEEREGDELARDWSGERERDESCWLSSSAAWRVAAVEPS